MVKYDAYQDDSDQENGHGTFVAGVIAGRKSSNGIATNQDGFVDGVARGAKLAFFDIGAGSGG